MDHYYQSIQGWFTFPEFYKSILGGLKEDSHIVEVGSWLGMSTVYMAVEIINSQKKIKFDAVDTWKGSEEHNIAEWSKELIDKDDVYNGFIKNIEPVKDYVKVVRHPSVEASKLYEDGSLDFVFIDAAHDYDNVLADLKAWHPKVKPEGIIAGHDYPFQKYKERVSITSRMLAGSLMQENLVGYSNNLK
jgi:predicted O-methyltransferase YrrM